MKLKAPSATAPTPRQTLPSPCRQTRQAPLRDCKHFGDLWAALTGTLLGWERHGMNRLTFDRRRT